MRKSFKSLEISKNKHCKQGIEVKNMSGMNFIHLLKEIGVLSMKNAKPQYANEI